MSGPRIPILLGDLSDEALLALAADGMVLECNRRATELLGESPIGRNLLDLLAARSREKGRAFLEALAALEPGAPSPDWELQLHLSGAAPLLISARGGRLPDGALLLAARSETGRLAPLYYEALAINDELTSLARRLSRENAALAGRLARYEERQR